MSEEVHIKKESDSRKVPVNVNQGSNIDVFTNDQDEDYIDNLIEEQEEKIKPKLTKNAQSEADHMRFNLFAEQKKVKSADQIAKEKSRNRSSSRRRSKSTSTNRSVSSRKSTKDVDYDLEKLTEDIDYDKIKDESRRERSALREDYERERSRSRIKSRSRSRSKKPESGGIFSNLFNMNKDNEDNTHSYSWFRDQILHPHETQHSLEEVNHWLEEVSFKLVSTSINNYKKFEKENMQKLYLIEKNLENLSYKNNVENLTFSPGYFTLCASKT